MRDSSLNSAVQALSVLAILLEILRASSLLSSLAAENEVYSFPNLSAHALTRFVSRSTAASSKPSETGGLASCSRLSV